MEIDNPSAFPRGYAPGGHNGMTLRDWFAGQALPSLLAGANNLDKMPVNERQQAWVAIAGIMYELADAMLAERAK